MPLSITHLYYADKILSNHPGKDKIDKQEYFIATTLPDIRYLSREEKKTTHPNFENSEAVIDKIKSEKDSYQLGLLAHWLVDYLWGEYWLPIYNNNPQEYLKNLIIDNVIYNRIISYPKINKTIEKYFNSFIFEEEEKYSQEILNKWHKFIKLLFSKPIDMDLGQKILELMGRNTSELQQLEEAIKIKSQNRDFVLQLKRFDESVLQKIKQINYSN